MLTKDESFVLLHSVSSPLGAGLNLALSFHGRQL